MKKAESKDIINARILSVKKLLSVCEDPKQIEPERCGSCFPSLQEISGYQTGMIPPELWGEALIQLGRCLFFRNQLTEAEQNLQRAQQLVSEGYSMERQHLILYYNAFIMWRWGRMDEAIELFSKVLPLIKAQNSQDLFAVVSMNLSALLLNKGKMEQSIAHAINAIDIFTELNDLPKAYMAKSNLGNLYATQGKFEQALMLKREVIGFFSSQENDKQLALEYNTLSTIYCKINCLEEAIDYALKSIQIREKLGEMDKIAFSWMNLGIYYKEFEQWDLALQYYHKALAEFQKEQDIESLGQVYNNIGNLYLNAKQNDKALENFTMAMQYHRQLDNKSGLSNALHSIGLIQAEESNDPATAMNCFRQAAELAEETEDLLLYVSTKLEIASLMIQGGDLEEAKQLLTEMESLLQETNCDTLNGRLFKTWEKLWIADQDFTMAHSVLNKFVTYMEQKHSATIVTKIAEMQTRYETEKKEREAEIYRLKNVELEEKNRLIEEQKNQLQDTLDKLQNSEIRYNFVSEKLFRSVKNTLIGKSEAIINITKMIAMVAKSEKTNVLITGETGTGKEIVARNIHACSKREKLHFYAVNCSAVPETLFESQFFGHEKDAFTGANTAKIGWFEIANLSTLFLDEIGTLSLDQQAKLLRTLEERQIIRVGSHKEIPVDVRIISATNLNLMDKVNTYEFRRDLYHRLAIFVIHIPPLRERKEEIPLLLEHFVGISSNTMNKKINKIEKEVVKNLMEYDFPGNVRELRNMVERAILVADSSTLRLQHFHIPINLECPETISKIVTLQDMERQLIIRTLQSTKYNQTQAAKLLGVERKVIERKIRKFNIVPE